MDADPVCAKKHAGKPVPNEMLVLGSGNTMGNIIVWVSKGLPAGKTWPAPKTPVVLDQKGCQYVPHVMGIMVGQPYRILNSDGILHNIHTLPKINPSFNRAHAGDGQGDDHDVRQAGGDLPDQVRRPPMDERLHRRLHPSLLLGDGARTGSSRSRASTRGPTRSPPGTRSWGRRRPRSRLAPATRRPRTSSSPRREVAIRRTAA